MHFSPQPFKFIMIQRNILEPLGLALRLFALYGLDEFERVVELGLERNVFFVNKDQLLLHLFHLLLQLFSPFFLVPSLFLQMLPLFLAISCFLGTSPCCSPTISSSRFILSSAKVVPFLHHLIQLCF